MLAVETRCAYTFLNPILNRYILFLRDKRPKWVLRVHIYKPSIRQVFPIDHVRKSVSIPEDEQR